MLKKLIINLCLVLLLSLITNFAYATTNEMNIVPGTFPSRMTDSEGNVENVNNIMSIIIANIKLFLILISICLFVTTFVKQFILLYKLKKVDNEDEKERILEKIKKVKSRRGFIIGIALVLFAMSGIFNIIMVPHVMIDAY